VHRLLFGRRLLLGLPQPLGLLLRPWLPQPPLHLLLLLLLLLPLLLLLRPSPLPTPVLPLPAAPQL
jgi:hypothetical protein